jgi:hypothetical protein
VLIQAKALAQRVLKEAGGDPAAQIKRTYAITLSRDPTALEMKLNMEFLQKQAAYALAHGATSDDAAKLAAMMDFAQVILDSNEFVYIG